MASKIIKTIFQLRRATLAEWEANKPIIPAAGEPCFVIDKNILKIGDGNTEFSDLEPINGVSVEVSGDGKSVVVTDNVFALMGFDAAEAGAQPRKNANGELEWVVPSTDTVEGLKSAVAGLQSDVQNLQEIVGTSEEEGSSLIDRIQNLEFKMDEPGVGTVDAKIDAKINEFASRVSDDGTVNTIVELVDYVANHGSEVATMASDISALSKLVGESPVKDQINNAIAGAGHIFKEEVNAIFEQKKYEIAGTPVGTLVDYRDKEIRVMCPVGTQFKTQAVGAGGDPNSYYMTFKTYVPNDNVVGYIEHLGDQVDEEILTTFSTDVYGRRYQPTWLALAKYDETTDTWTYYGEKSTTDKYIGYDYQIDWYDANGVVIASDKIRINLTNEVCHNEIKPFYMANASTNAIEGIKVGETLLDVVDKQVVIPVGAGLKGSDEIEIAEDGSLRIKAMSWDKLIDGEDEIIMDGGSAV